MARSIYSKRRKVPRISPNKSQLESFDYSEGLNTFWANDTVPKKKLVHATDARMPTLGRYKTRKGLDRLTDPVGEATAYTRDDTASETDTSFEETVWIADSFSPSSTDRLTKVDVRIKKPSDTTGTVLIKVHKDNGGEPGEVIAESSIAQADIDSTYAYVSCDFVSAPELDSANTYWVSASVQPKGNNSYDWSSTSAATTAVESTDSGVSWSSLSVSFNMKVYLSTDGATLGVHRTKTSSGADRTFFAHNTDVYKYTDAGGVASIKSGLSSNATKYRFETVDNTVFYVNGKDAPRKYDLGTDTEDVVGGSPDVAFTLIEHKGIMFYADANDRTKVFFSNFSDYETFTSTDFIHVPAPKKADKIQALAKLNDNLVIFTRNNKFILSGSDRSTFRLRQAPGQKGTFSQECVRSDRNYLYYLSDDGLYQFNGTTDKLLSEEVTDIVDEIVETSPEDACTGLANNRFYVFYTPSGESRNTKSLVYNINHDSFESVDLNTFISATDNFAESTTDYIQASNSVGALYKAEQPSNDHSNLGAPLDFELRTKYHHFDKPGQKKIVRKWQPRFASQTGNYNVACQFDFDFNGSPQNKTVSVSGDGPKFGGGETWGGGATFGSSNLVNNTLYPEGDGAYIQFRYKHKSARQPLEFEGHTLEIHTRRLR